MGTGRRESALLAAEELADSENVARLAAAIWQSPELGRLLAEQPEEILARFDIVLPEAVDLVPLGAGGRLGKPTPDFLPFEIRLTRCRTVVVRDEDSGVFKTETVCFGFEIIPKQLPGGPVGRP